MIYLSQGVKAFRVGVYLFEVRSEKEFCTVLVRLRVSVSRVLA